MDLHKAISTYVPWNEQERQDRLEIMRRLERGEPLLERSNRSAHMTASAWVVSPDRTRVLMAHHNIYNSWAWLGGHADGDSNLLRVALREVQEESGLISLRPVSEDIFSLEILAVAGHEKRGVYVPSHLHLNVTYLLEAEPTQPVRCKKDENSGVAWFSPEEAIAVSDEQWFRERVYQKLIQKAVGFC